MAHQGQGVYIQIPRNTLAVPALQKAINEDSQLFQDYVGPVLYKLKVYDFISMLFAAGIFAVALLIAGGQKTEIYYPLYSSGVQYFIKDQAPPVVSDLISEINKCPSSTFMSDGGPVTEWDGTAFLPFYYPQSASKLNPWPLVLIVLAFTFLFTMLRWALAIGSAVPLYMPVGPHFFRWLEYLITSPLMIVVIAIAAGVRDVHTLTLLGGAQAMLIMLGFCNEHLIADIWDCLLYKLLAQTLMPFECTEAQALATHHRQHHGTSQNGRPTPARSVLDKLAAEQHKDECLPHDPQQRALAIGHENLEAAFRLMHVILKSYDETDGNRKAANAMDLCNFHYASRLPLLLWRVFVTLIASWVGFVCMWVVIIGQFQTLSDSFNTCGGSSSTDISVPVGVQLIVWGQLGAFGAFGLVQSWQIFVAWREVRADFVRFSDAKYSTTPHFIAQVDSNYKKYYQASVGNFLQATRNYTILNIISKSLLAVCLIIISSDMQPSED